MMLISLLFVLSSVAISPASGGVSLAAVQAGLETANAVIAEARAMWLNSASSDIMATEQIPYHCSLAASFGNLTSAEVKAMDDELQIIIAGTNKILRQARQQYGANLTFDDYAYIMKQNPLLQTDTDEDVVRGKFKGYSKIRFAQNSIDEKVVQEVADWFANEVVIDPDVLDATKIDIIDYANIVAATGAALDSLEALFVKRDYTERSVVDLGVLRYPDLQHPYFKLFRIRILAFKGNTRILFLQKDTSGIRGQFESKIFRPNETILNKMKESVKNKAKAEAQKMFGS